MNMKQKATFVAMVAYGLGFFVPANASQQLDEINAKVEQQAQGIDQKYGVLLDYQERSDLKLDLISKQALVDAQDSGKSVKQIADEAFATYEVTDPAEQRKLLIKIEAQKSTGGGGTRPDYP